MRGLWLAVPLAVVSAACNSYDVVNPGALVAPPSNLQYTVDPSGTSGSPAGVLLRWDYEIGRAHV